MNNKETKVCWLTINKDGLVIICEAKPIYDDGKWIRTNESVYKGIKSILGWPQFEEFAANLNLTPGEMGIAKVSIKIKLISIEE